MKRIIFTLMPLLFMLTAKAQKTDTLKKVDLSNQIFAVAEHEPDYPGGIKKYKKYLDTAIHYPISAKQQNLGGRVILSMIVEKDGSLSDIKVERGISDDLDKEAVRVVKNSPKWQPALQNGRVVRAFWSTIIIFKLPDE